MSTPYSLIGRCDICGNVTAVDLDGSARHEREMQCENRTVSRVSREEAERLWNTGAKCDHAAFFAKLKAENAQLRAQLGATASLLEQMLNVAENADETGYVADCGFVDLDALHAKVHECLSDGAASRAMEQLDAAMEDSARIDWLETTYKEIRCETEDTVAHMKLTICQQSGVKDSPCGVRAAIDSARKATEGKLSAG